MIFCSDRGCQYTSREFADPAGDCEVALSPGRTSQRWDNASSALTQKHPPRLMAEFSARRPVRGSPGGACRVSCDVLAA
jgi:hypothetical protein